MPTIYWFKKDVFAGPTHLSDSSTLILENVDRHHAGIYQCSADNGVKERVSMDIQLTILCKFTNIKAIFRENYDKRNDAPIVVIIIQFKYFQYGLWIFNF